MAKLASNSSFPKEGNAQFLLTSLQKFNGESAFLLKQMSMVLCLFRHSDRNIELNMDMKTTRMKLNVAFKQFQRLPEWPVIIKSADRQSSSDQHGEGRKTAAAPAWSEDDFRPQSFAE